LEDSYQKSFTAALKEKIKAPNCRFCGANEYATLNSRAMITMDEVNDEGKRKILPSGIIICRKCGHIEFFALGALDPKLMVDIPSEPSKTDGEDKGE